jgi:hypothetical protein
MKGHPKKKKKTEKSTQRKTSFRLSLKQRLWDSHISFRRDCLGWDISSMEWNPQWREEVILKRGFQSIAFTKVLDVINISQII